MSSCLRMRGQDLTGPNLTGQAANVSFPGSRQTVRTSRVRITQGLTVFSRLAVRNYYESESEEQRTIIGTFVLLCHGRYVLTRPLS